MCRIIVIMETAAKATVTAGLVAGLIRHCYRCRYLSFTYSGHPPQQQYQPAHSRSLGAAAAASRWRYFSFAFSHQSLIFSFHSVSSACQLPAVRTTERSVREIQRGIRHATAPALLHSFVHQLTKCNRQRPETKLVEEITHAGGVRAIPSKVSLSPALPPALPPLLLFVCLLCCWCCWKEELKTFCSRCVALDPAVMSLSSSLFLQIVCPLSLLTLSFEMKKQGFRF